MGRAIKLWINIDYVLFHKTDGHCWNISNIQQAGKTGTADLLKAAKYLDIHT
jgi:hypothetical protein